MNCGASWIQCCWFLTTLEFSHFGFRIYQLALISPKAPSQPKGCIMCPHVSSMIRATVFVCLASLGLPGSCEPVGLGVRDKVAFISRLAWTGSSSPRSRAKGTHRGSSPCEMTTSAPKRVVRRVAVIGAGIGGLALADALCSLDTGVDEVEVFEKYDSVKPGIGGGIQINSGAVVLARLGLGEAVKAAGNPVERILARTIGGRTVLDLDVGKMIRSDPARESAMVDRGTPMVFTIMRDRLMQILAGSLPEGVLKTGRNVVDIMQSPGGATLRFQDGSEAGPFDVVVGADGIKGAVRGALRTGKGAGTPRDSSDAIYSGLRVQFGVAPGGQRPRGCERELHQWFGGDTYALSATYGGIEGAKYEMVAAVYQDFSRKDENAEWDPALAKEVCVDRLVERNFPTEMVAVAEAGERFFELGVYYRNPLEGWVSGGFGQVVLLGDAAHAMPPNLGQGANQAIQDAYCLAERLAILNRGGYDGSLPDALRDYERRRKPDTTSVLLKSAILGKVETLGGVAGEAFRNNFFFGTWKLGVAERVFIDGAMPKV